MLMTWAAQLAHAILATMAFRIMIVFRMCFGRKQDGAEKKELEELRGEVVRLKVSYCRTYFPESMVAQMEGDGELPCRCCLPV